MDRNRSINHAPPFGPPHPTVFRKSRPPMMHICPFVPHVATAPSALMSTPVMSTFWSPNWDSWRADPSGPTTKPWTTPRESQSASHPHT